MRILRTDGTEVIGPICRANACHVPIPLSCPYRGGTLHKIGEVVTETMGLVPRRRKVIQHVRESMAADRVRASRSRRRPSPRSRVCEPGQGCSRMCCSRVRPTSTAQSPECGVWHKHRARRLDMSHIRPPKGIPFRFLPPGTPSTTAHAGHCTIAAGIKKRPPFWAILSSYCLFNRASREQRRTSPPSNKTGRQPWRSLWDRLGLRLLLFAGQGEERVSELQHRSAFRY